MSRGSHRARVLEELALAVDPAEIEQQGALLVCLSHPSFTLQLVAAPENGSVARWYEPIPDGESLLLNVIPADPRPVIMFLVNVRPYDQIIEDVVRCNERLRECGLAGDYNARLMGRFRFRQRSGFLTCPYTFLQTPSEDSVGQEVPSQRLWRQLRLRVGSLRTAQIRRPAQPTLPMHPVTKERWLDPPSRPRQTPLHTHLTLRR